MAKRERMTERNRPHRRDLDGPGGGGGGGGGDGLNNPVVMVALGGLVLAVVLAVAVLIGRSMSENGQTTADAPEAATPITQPTPVEQEPPPTPGDAAASDPDTTTDQEDAPPVPDKTQYSAPEDQSLDGEANAYIATIETNKGTIKAELWPALAPETVNSFVFLAREGFFDGLTFHRVEEGFVIQGGDPLGNGSGGPGYSLPAEFNDVPHEPGILSMARTNDPNSAGSQFFIVLPPEPASFLDNQYTVFGYTFEGMDVVESIVVGDVMESVTIEELPSAESVVSPDDIRSGNLPGQE